jgi:hypothetical protein
LEVKLICNPEREKSAGRTTNHESKLPNGKPMNQEDIIRMAREAELNAHGLVIDRLERFAKLVAAHEREKPVQVSPLEFVTAVLEKEHLVGKPLMWAQWPNEEKK